MYHTKFVVPKPEVPGSEQDAKDVAGLRGIAPLLWNVKSVSAGMEVDDTTAAGRGRREGIGKAGREG